MRHLVYDLGIDAPPSGESEVAGIARDANNLD